MISREALVGLLELIELLGFAIRQIFALLGGVGDSDGKVTILEEAVLVGEELVAVVLVAGDQVLRLVIHCTRQRLVRVAVEGLEPLGQVLVRLVALDGWHQE